MAFNNFDKLCKAQRDYPKPRFAYAVAEKALKKQPQNPYILTWKADLMLQLGVPEPEHVVEILEPLHRSPVSDTELLVYMYQKLIEALRRGDGGNGLRTNTVGKVALGCWQLTAKSQASKTDRMKLWDTLFHTAMREDCWEDVRVAMTNYNKEGSSSKKQCHFSLILVTQLAAEQRLQRAGPDDSMAKLQCDIACKLMKQAYMASSTDLLAFKDIRDLRFMAAIFARQNRCRELMDLWQAPPEHLKPVLKLHEQDLQTIKLKLLVDAKNWPLVTKFCLETIEEVVAKLATEENSNSGILELCGRRWDLWSALLCALRETRTKEQSREIISPLISEYFSPELAAKDRHFCRTRMALRYFIGESMLADCKDYFRNFAQLVSCFNDIQTYLCGLSREQLKDFYVFADDNLRERASNEGKAYDLQQCHITFQRCEYSMVVSKGLKPNTPVEVFESLIHGSINAYEKWPENPDVFWIPIYSLLHFHRRWVCQREEESPFGTALNSRILLQATMLARHITEKDKGKENRKFFLLAARLHLNLGLGTVAFRLYTHVKCKEMMLDTLSPYMLSRISYTHPFDVAGRGGFSATRELDNVISTIERMEQKQNGFIFTDVPSFLWDQAADSLELKRRLRSSWTKHICATERRRISRLMGEPCLDLPKLDYKTYNDIQDNIDRSIFPNFELSTLQEPILNLVMPNPIPNEGFVVRFHAIKEAASACLYREGLNEDHVFNDFDAWLKILASKGLPPSSNHTLNDWNTHRNWDNVSTIVVATRPSRPVAPNKHLLVVDVLENIKQVRKGFEKLRMPGSTNLEPKDEPTMFHENMLIVCYTHLEFCRAVGKLVDWIVERIMKPKGAQAHPWKTLLPKGIDAELLDEAKICFQAVRDVAESYIVLLKKRGVTAITEQVRWGATGKSLRAVLRDDDLAYYAQEYVESALEGWKGVLKVKFK